MSCSQFAEILQTNGYAHDGQPPFHDSRRRSPVAARPTRRRLHALVVIVALWPRSGAARMALVSGLRPVITCVPLPTPPGPRPLRGHWPLCAGLPVRPRGGSLSRREGTT